MHSSPRPPGTAGSVRLGAGRHRISAAGVVVITVSAAAPAAKVITFTTGGAATAGFAIVVVIVGALVMLQGVGYLAAARTLTDAGVPTGFYTVVAHGLGRLPGITAGWIAVAAYTALAAGMAGMAGHAVSTAVAADGGGDAMPWQIGATTVILVAGTVGAWRLAAVRAVLGIVAALQIAAMVFLALSGSLPHTLLGDQAAEATGPAPLILGAAVFAGVEISVMYVSSCRAGHRGITRAGVTTLGLLIVLTAGTTIALSSAAKSDVADAATPSAGPLIAGWGIVAASAAAATVALHNAATAYAVQLGRDAAAPAVLGTTSTRRHRPVIATAVQTLLGFAAIGTATATGMDVLTFSRVTLVSGTVGILVLLAVTALSVTAQCVTRSDRESPAARTRRRRIGTSSITASVLLTFLALLVLSRPSAALGVGPESWLPATVLAGYVVVLVIATVWALLMRRRTELYRRVAGLGTATTRTRL
ncbi:hypothetical protein [Amycolatopsis sp. RTGN1]|uniref:hypothetical protein n=1 Tax=Amycolatopsis ponsaeliensis TaxID=2992142 RepID=UPI00254ED7B6|nr:hypothetical protein [Amycolatopsis sp. RTGN1]